MTLNAPPAPLRSTASKWLVGPWPACVPFHSDKGLSVETGGVVTITYRNGLLATIDCSWSVPDNGPTWGGLTLQVTGTNGSVEIAPFQQHVGGTDRDGEVFLPVGGDLDYADQATLVHALEGRREM